MTSLMMKDAGGYWRHDAGVESQLCNDAEVEPRQQDFTKMFRFGGWWSQRKMYTEYGGSDNENLQACQTIHQGPVRRSGPEVLLKSICRLTSTFDALVVADGPNV
jgi:hypothetical protein